MAPSGFIERKRSDNPRARISAHEAIQQTKKGTEVGVPILRLGLDPTLAEASDVAVPAPEDITGTHAGWPEMPQEPQKALIVRFLLHAGTDRTGRESETGCSQDVLPSAISDAPAQLLLCELRRILVIFRAEQTNQKGALSRADRAVLKLIGLVERKGGNIDLSLKTSAGEFGVSRNHLGREFSRIAGVSFRSYLRTVRNVRVAELLATDSHSICEIAADLGYSEPSNMFREFLDVIAVSPSQFRGFHARAAPAQE